MANTKDRLTDLETGLGMVQDELQKLTTGIADKFRSLEENQATKHQSLEKSINHMLEMMTHNREGASSAPRGNSRLHDSPHSVHRTEPTTPFGPAHAPILHRHIKLDLPRFNGGDPTEWISKSKQYFAYQDIPTNQQVSLASYHLTEEANEWWQATMKALDTDASHTTWETFETELWVRFGPTQGDNFHEALSKIRQTGPLREYQREFERLQNKVNNWSEEALVGTFLGGLNESIAANVRMFSPKTLREVINLARLSDEQLQKQRRPFGYRNFPSSTTTSAPRTALSTPSGPRLHTPQESQSQTPKKLSWEEMK